ncbi:glycoside hydrolase family 15 protein [Consotaella salsifontis]|uniref:glucan 1,4-alpha-glucosidase n=1 Tax=Consotaella salsifontis TaxID=1365950 RepID=A0A1T4LGQ4_9HYPH|nr:glycoside hydrolase family 15 protein [Consotaella salsifontis]SJZ53840.1 glucoamylase [Consotaella salsifontis]
MDRAQGGIEDWITRQKAVSEAALRGAISREDLTHERKGFGVTIRPRRGSVLASPVSAHYDPDPDYFFHWFRDSAVIMEALRVSEEISSANALFADFIRFNDDLRHLNGAEAPSREASTAPEFQQYLRPPSDLAAVHGEDVSREARVNADGTLDFTRWARPQKDGPAARALTLARWWDRIGPDIRPTALDLIVEDLHAIRSHLDEPSYDIWEEELGDHYYTDLLQCAALKVAAVLFTKLGEPGSAACDEAAERLEDKLARYVCDEGWYHSRLPTSGTDERKCLDMATIFAVLHSDFDDGRHSVLDPSVQATFLRLEDHFAMAYPINKEGPGALAPAMGRYPGDHYFSGGAYYFSTFAAAEFHFTLALATSLGARLPITLANRPFLLRCLGEDLVAADCAVVRPSPEVSERFLHRGDAFLKTARAFTPPSGELSEQFDQTDGRQTSAKDLAWSHAAFLTATHRREQARAAARNEG